MLVSVFETSRFIWKKGRWAAVVVGVVYFAILLFENGVSASVLRAIVPTVLLVGIARVCALVAAQEAHIRLLSILYNDLEPGRFVEQYEPVCSEPMSDACRRIMQMHLANGYAYGGDVEKALERIASLPLSNDRHPLDTQLVIVGNTCTYRLMAQDVDGAREAQQRMAALLEQARQEKKKLSPNYDRTLRLNQVQLDLEENRAADVGPVREELARRSNALHTAVCHVLLARIYAAAGKRNEALGVLQQVTGLTGSATVLRQARDLQKQLQETA